MTQAVMKPDAIREIVRTAEKRVTKPSIETLLLDRVGFPKRALSGGGKSVRLNGHGQYVVVVRSTFRKPKSKVQNQPEGRVEPGDLQVQWLYIEWQREDAILLANGTWTYHSGTKEGSVGINNIGIVKVVDGARLRLERAAKVAVMADRAVVKIKDLQERELYSILAEFNGQGRDGFSAQTGPLN